ncbi:hypothetical protein B0H11DRAFT_2351108 [Mycena galericulata]|nr:hypothetical protein B0H11DRAFT_2351108 [Mycena galericulata]
MPRLPIDILENIVDASAGYPLLLRSLSLASRILTARTRVNIFHTIHLGTPKGPHREKPAVRCGKIIPTRCDAFLELCSQNPGIALHVRVLVILESVWHPTTGLTWLDYSHSIVPLVRSLHNLKGFALRTEGISVALSPPSTEAFFFILSKPDMEWIEIADIGLVPVFKLFRIFRNAASLRRLSLADFGLDLHKPILPDFEGYVPMRIDTLAISFDILRFREEGFIRNTLQPTCPLFDMHHIRCLQLDIYHSTENMDRVHAWLSKGPSVEELVIRIIPGNKALREFSPQEANSNPISNLNHLIVWRLNQLKWRKRTTDHFDSSNALRISHLQKISVQMRDHDGIGKLATFLEFIALAESLTDVTIHFTSARGLLTWLDEEAWGLVDDALVRAPVFPVLERIQVSFGKNSCFLEKLEEKFGNIMPKTADILRITEVP